MKTWTIATLGACFAGSALFACSTQIDLESNGVGGGDEWAGEYDAGSTSGDGGLGDGGIFGDGAPSAKPMLVQVDPNATMVQTPGEGVGVFVQYVPTTPADPGGHWYVWWTCDTSKSGDACNFDVGVSVAQGAITNAVADGFAASDSLTGAGVAASTSTTSESSTSGSGTGASGTGASTGGSASWTGGNVGWSGGSASGAGSSTGSATPVGNVGSFLTAETTTTSTVQGVHFDTAPGAIITLSAAVGGEYTGQILFFVQDGKVNGGYQGALTDPLELEPSSP